MIEITVDQAKLHALQQRLKVAGEKGLTRELNKSLREAAVPIAEAEKAAALGLPAYGSRSTGLRASIAEGVRISVTSSAKNPGVRIRSRARLARASTARSWRHPVFGNRNVWVSQTLTPGWFAAVASSRRADVVKKVEEAVQRIARQIAR